MRCEVHTVEPTAAVEHVTTMEEIRRTSLAPRTFAMRLLLGFSGVATILAFVGIYGVLSVSVGSCVKEIAVRKAIGAQQSEILGAILGEGGRLILIGVTLGGFVALLAGRVLEAGPPAWISPRPCVRTDRLRGLSLSRGDCPCHAGTVPVTTASKLRLRRRRRMCAMPRRRRFTQTGTIFHVVNRGVEKRRLFFESADYESFLRLLCLGKERHAVSVLGICVMPNHYHVLLRPQAEGALSAYLHWVQGCYACDFRAHTQSKGHGHVFQQRFWSGAIFDDRHFLNVLRYIEANPASSQLVARAEQWAWSSLALRYDRGDRVLDPLPVGLPPDWTDIVNEQPQPGEAD